MTQNHRRIALMLIVVFCISLMFRIWGIDNGLPHVQRPDETGDIAQALQIVKGQIPRYTYHRVVWSIMQIPLHGVHFVISAIQKNGFGISDFETSYYINRASFILSARIYVAVFGALTCMLVGFTGYFLTYKWQAFVASAAILAVYPTHVYMSHIGLPDVFGTFAVGICLLNTVLIVKRRSRLAYCAAGIGAGLAMLARLQAIPLVILAVALAHVVSWWGMPQRSWRFFWTHWLWAFAGFVATHIVFNPFVILQPQAVWNDILFIFSERFTGTYYAQAGYTYNPLANVSANISLPIILLRPYLLATFALATLVAFIKRNTTIVVISVPTWIFIASLLTTWLPRTTYWLPATVPVSIVAGWFVWTTWQSQQKWVHYLGIAIFGVIFLAGFVETAKIDHTLAQPDTQSLAYDFITDEVPNGARILIGDTFVYSVPLDRNIASIERLSRIKSLPASYQFFLENPDHLPTPSYDIYGYEYIPNIQSDADMRAFIEEYRIDYVVEVDYCGGTTPYNFMSGLTFPAISDAIRSELQLVYSVAPFIEDECLQHIENRTHMEYMRLWDWQRVGPIVRIYQTALME